MNQYTIFPLGDSAATIDFGNFINEELNKKVIAMQSWLMDHPFSGIRDLVVSYSSLTIIYDAEKVRASQVLNGTVFNYVKQKLEESLAGAVVQDKGKNIKRIPVCYDPSFGYDLDNIAAEKKISVEEVIRLHSAEIYRVYMIGFLPGFPYMAAVNDKISVSRKHKPRSIIKSGSVGLAGKQTGIYSLDSPGGWQIIGRIPMRLFDKNKPNALIIKAGDYVQFYPIALKDFLTLSQTKS
ncbi:MAG: 5-oxoprolinase subunit PxpB [Chitinophagaceae bacterium]